MSISQVALRLQSGETTANELTAAMGCEPTSAVGRGEFVSARAGRGPVREVSTWVLESEIVSESVSEHLSKLAGALRRARGFGVGGEVAVDLVVAVTSRPMGSQIDLSVQDIAVLSENGCGLVVDAYCDDNDASDGYEDSESDRSSSPLS